MPRASDQAGLSGLRKGCRGAAGPCRGTGEYRVWAAPVLLLIQSYVIQVDTQRSDVYNLLEAARLEPLFLPGNGRKSRDSCWASG